MANAGFGLPYIATISIASGNPEVRSASNLANDEPGLVYESGNVVANNGVVAIKVACSGAVSFVSVLGLNVASDIRVFSYTSQANMDANTSPVLVANYTAAMSTNKSSTNFKHFVRFNDVSTGFYRVELRNLSGATASLTAWRLLIGKWIEPADNIEVQAQASIDDRSARRYSSIGRRNFTKYGIYPTFTGKWPWISDTEYKTMIRPMMLQYGASVPVLFVLDYAESVWGQDGLYYGDLERDQSIVLDDGQLYSYSFTIVDIAPVDLTA